MLRSWVVGHVKKEMVTGDVNIRYTTIAEYDEHLKPNTSDIELFRIFSLSDEFKCVVLCVCVCVCVCGCCLCVECMLHHTDMFLYLLCVLFCDGLFILTLCDVGLQVHECKGRRAHRVGEDD